MNDSEAAVLYRDAILDALDWFHGWCSPSLTAEDVEKRLHAALVDGGDVALAKTGPNRVYTSEDIECLDNPPFGAEIRRLMNNGESRKSVAFSALDLSVRRS